jgi:hypothetical protein
LKIFILKSHRYHSYISSSFKTKSRELCQIWRRATLNNVSHDDDDDDADDDDDDEDDDNNDFGGGVGSSVTGE